MKKTKVLLILFLILLVSIMPFNCVNAHSVDLDPQKLISFPFMISNGKGNITVQSSETNYSLYWQAVEIENAIYNQIEKTRNDGDIELENMKTEIDALDNEYDNLKTAYDEALDAYQNASEDQKEQTKAAYETAKTNLQNKKKEYNSKVDEYNSKVKEINSKINELTPAYVEDNWIKTDDGSFEIDLSKFSGNKSFAVWVKLVSADGTISYDEATYTMSGTKVEQVDVESISLDKTSLSLNEGSSYTLTATITPSDATNKLVVWSSDNEKVAKVENGKITAISKGTATITATTKDGEHTATCKVTVIQKTDPTIADGKLPQTGSLTYFVALVVLFLGIIGIVTYRKVKHLNFK